MNTSTDIAGLYPEFTDALTKVLAENAVGPARRGRLDVTKTSSNCRL